MTASGTPGNAWIGGRTQDLSYGEIRTAVEEAAKFGKRVHAHAHDPQGLREAVAAGVVSLHSGEFADEAGLQLMKEKDCVFMATIAWAPTTVERPCAALIADAALGRFATLRALHRSHVPMALLSGPGEARMPLGNRRAATVR